MATTWTPPTRARIVSTASAAAPRHRPSLLPGPRIDPLRLAVIGLPPVGVGHASLGLRVESLTQGTAHEFRALARTTRRDALQLLCRPLVQFDYDLPSHSESRYLLYAVSRGVARRGAMKGRDGCPPPACDSEKIPALKKATRG